jgi:transposase
MIRMDEFNKIRKAYFADKLSINEIADKFHRSWATVHKIINTPREDEFSAGERKLTRVPKVATQEVMDAIADRIREEQLLKVKKKQRVSATVIFEELTKKGIYQGSQRRMQELVKITRQKLDLTEPESFLPLEFPHGSMAQIDHGEVDCIVNKERRTCFLFVLAVPGAGLKYCQLFATKSQEAWGEFHERAFRFFNGIFPRIMYDNDTVLVKYSKEKRTLTNFCAHLVEHYDFETNFCNPSAGNEKGSVENNVGFCRRNYLYGCPVFEDTQHANAYLEDKCRQAFANGIHSKLQVPLSTILAKVKANLFPLLPVKNWRSWAQRKVNAYQQINIDGHCYSVPEKYLMADLRVGIGIESIDIFDGNTLIVSHRRQFTLGTDSLILDHYLDQLARKPGALWDCKAINEVAKDELYLHLWNHLMSLFPKMDENQKLRYAQKTFIDILRLRRTYSMDQLRSGIKKAIDCRCSISASSIECIIAGILKPEQLTSEPAFKRFNIPHWEFDLSSYGTLVQEAMQC